jgi:hypothetical protein
MARADGEIAAKISKTAMAINAAPSCESASMNLLIRSVQHTITGNHP